jgi:peptide/nickel transport system substrate-binding protein
LTLISAGAITGAAWWWRSSARPSPSASLSADVPRRGGRLIASFRSEPKTFNRLYSPQIAEELVRLLTQATLVRVNRITKEIEPRLATSWTSSTDGKTWTLTLRDDVRFSDGTRFSSADVVFTFRAIYEAKTAMAGNLLVNGQPLAVRALDDRTVEIAFPAPYGSGLAIVEGVPVLPRHKLAAAFEAGTLRDAWNVTTPLHEIVGAGPFVLQQYTPAVSLVFARNPHYWVRDRAGVALPYLDEIELKIVPEQNAEILQLESGRTDLITDFIRAEDVASFSRLADTGRLQLSTVGAALNPDLFWINLVPAAPAANERPWLQRQELREAISHAVDRQAIVNTVYLGEAEAIEGPITSSYGIWHVPGLAVRAHDPAKAKTLLQSIGLTDGNQDGRLEDGAGRQARFSVLTVKGGTLRERTLAVVQKHLADVGLQLDVVALDQGSLIQRFMKGEYEAIFFSFSADLPDPNRMLEFWLSSGSFHVWNPGQSSPSQSWEAEINDLVTRQSLSMNLEERRQLFEQAQRRFLEHVPAIYFAAQRHVVAMSARVQGATPTAIPPPVLWNAETIALRTSATR